jgi:hypothetical protein
MGDHFSGRPAGDVGVATVAPTGAQGTGGLILMAVIASGRRNHAGIFLVLFALTALVQFAVLLAVPIRPLVDAFSEHLASLSAWLIGTLGGACSHHGAFLTNPSKKFSMEIRDGCNGVNVVILLWAGILAYPAGWKWKLAGLGGGMEVARSSVES